MKRILTIAALITGIAVSSSATTYYVQDADSFNAQAKRVQAGDSIVLAPGIWTDVQLVLKRAPGTEAQPVTGTVAEKG